MKVLLDTNIIIDFLTKREPFAKDVKEVIALIETKEIEGYLSASTITTIYYLAQKVFNKEKADITIKDLLTIFEITSLEKKDFLKAIEINGNDFEDSVIIATALENNIDIIITRDKKDFLKSEVLALEPKEFLVTFHQG
jgi:predicted nucleic acid-binding protein